MTDEENDRPAGGKRDPLEAEAMSIPVPYDRMEAFGTFTHEELVAAVKMWIERCDKAETYVAELLLALQTALRAPGIHATDQETGETFSEVIHAAIARSTT